MGAPGPGITEAWAIVRSAPVNAGTGMSVPAMGIAPLSGTPISAHPGATAGGLLDSSLVLPSGPDLRTAGPVAPRTARTVPGAAPSAAAVDAARVAPKVSISPEKTVSPAFKKVSAGLRVTARRLPGARELERATPSTAKTRLDGFWTRARIGLADTVSLILPASLPGTVAPGSKLLAPAGRAVPAADGAKTPPAAKTQARIRGRSLWQRFWKPAVLAGAALLAAQFLPHAAHALLPLAAMFCAVCVTFRTLEETEAGRIGFKNGNERREAMKELSGILRRFGSQVEAESRDPSIKSKVSAELVARTAQKAMVYALDAFLYDVRANPPEDQEAAVKRFEAIVMESIVAAMKSYGMSADPEETIRAIIRKTGVLAKIVKWQDRHRFVATILEKARKGEIPAAESGRKAEEKKSRSFGSGNADLIAFLAVGLSWGLLYSLGLVPLDSGLSAASLAVVAAILQPGQEKEAEKKPLEHRLEAWLTEEDIELLKQFTTEVESDRGRPLMGRSEEVRKVLDSLSKPKGLSRSVLLTGRSGVGRRALVEHIAGGIAEGRFQGLDDAVVLELDPTRLIGSSVEAFAQQLRQILVKTRGRVILFIPNAEQLKGAGMGDTGYAFFRILRPAMLRGKLTVIAAAQASERNRLLSDGAFAETIAMEEPSEEGAVGMVGAHAAALERLFELPAEPGVVKTAVRLAARHLHDSALPGSALKLLEKAFTRRTPAAVKNQRAALIRQSTQQLLHDINRYQRLSRDGVAGDRLDRVYNAVVRNVERLMSLQQEERDGTLPAGPLTAGDLAETVAELTGIPTSRVLKDEAAKLRTLEPDLKKRVVHQDDAVSAISRAVRRARAGLKDPNKPIGSFLFVGPTGVGKTELAKALSELLFDDEENLIRIDMSEYKEPHSVARLSGTHPGYVGFDEGGQLTEAVRKRPYAVVLLDEIEKAHPEVLDLLLQVMDDGRLTDGHGNTVRFSNVILIMTSNLGSSHIQQALEEGADAEEIKREVDIAIKEGLRPEFVNRLTEIIQFNALDEKAAEDITELHLKNKVDRWLRKRDNETEVSLKFPVARKVLRLLVEKGFDRLYGGRSLERTVQRLLLDPLAPKLIEQGRKADGGSLKVRLEARDKDLGFRIETIPAAPVERLTLADAETKELLDELLKRQEPLTLAELEGWLLGDPESAISREPMGPFHPMAAPLEGEPVEERKAESDNPDLKDAVQDAIRKEWPGMLGLGKAAAVAFARWYDKTLRCAKSTNFKKSDAPKVTSRWVRTAEHDELQIHAQPLTRSELLETAQIFQNHFSQDSKDEDESWDKADELIDKGLYGRAELFEVKRLIGAVPGAEFGFWSDRGQLVFWLRLPRTSKSSPDTSAQVLPGKPQAVELSKSAELYQSLTKDAAPETEKIRALIASLLSSEKPMTQYWGFRAAKATLSEESFAELSEAIPPLEFLPAEAAKAFRQDILGQPRHASSSVTGDVERRLREVADREHRERLASAEVLASYAETVTSEQRASLLEAMLTKAKRRRTRNHLIKLAFINGAIGLLILAGYLVAQWIFPGLPLPFGLTPTGFWAHIIPIAIPVIAALIVLIPDSSANDAIMDADLHSLQDYARNLEVLTVLRPMFPADERKRVHRAWAGFVLEKPYRKRYLRGQYTALMAWRAKAAAALAADVDALDPGLRKSVAADLVREVEAEPPKDRYGSSKGRISALHAMLDGFDLLDEAQQARALELFLRYGSGSSGTRSDRKSLLKTVAGLVVDGKIPVSQRTLLLNRVVEMIHEGNEKDSASLYGALEALAPDLPEKKAESLADILWKARADKEVSDNPTAFYKALAALSRDPSLARSFADKVLEKGPSEEALETLGWLMRDQAAALGPDRIARIRELVVQKAREGNKWAVRAVASLQEIPWQQRLDILIDAYAGKKGEGLEGEEFIDTLAEYYRDQASKP